MRADQQSFTPLISGNLRFLIVKQMIKYGQIVPECGG